MNTFCYIFIYIFEQFVSYFYFNNRFEKKRNNWQIRIAFFLSFSIQFSFNLFHLPVVNLISFFLCNYLIAMLCFKTTLKQCFFHAILLVGLMLTTELIVMYAYSAITKTNLLEYDNNPISILLQTLTTKALYFLVVYILSQIGVKKERAETKSDNLLLFYPIASIIIIYSFHMILLNLEIDETIYVLFAVIAFVLLFSNVFVFFIHEQTKVTLEQNAEYRLELQKNEINQEYFKELERQYDLSSLLLHDMKKHFNVIIGLAKENDNDRIMDYLSSICDGYEVYSIRKYSNNKLINVILSRYFNLCQESDIDFSTDIRNVDFSFMSESDLTALLNNLLENAYESACTSSSRFLHLSIDEKQERFILIQSSNSCDVAPQKKNNYFLTSKTDKKHHGYGLKSIQRIVNRYEGYLRFEFNEENHSFRVSVFLKSH